MKIYTNRTLPNDTAELKVELLQVTSNPNPSLPAMSTGLFLPFKTKLQPCLKATFKWRWPKVGNCLTRKMLWEAGLQLAVNHWTFLQLQQVNHTDQPKNLMNLNPRVHRCFDNMQAAAVLIYVKVGWVHQKCQCCFEFFQ